MTALPDETQRSRDSDNKKIKPYIHLTPFLEETKQYQDATKEDGDIVYIDLFPTLVLPVVGIDDIPTKGNLHAVSKLSDARYFAMDGLAVSEQPTWIIPVIRVAGKTPKLEAHDDGTENYISLVRTLFKSSGIYALASIATPLVSLILAPFLTHYLSHTEFGALAVLNTVITLVAGVTQLGVGSAFYRVYSYDYESPRDRLTVLSTVTILLLLTSLPTVIMGIGAAPWLAVLLLNSSSFSDAMRLASVCIVLQNLTVPAFSWLRVENRAAFSVVLSIVNLLVSAGANIVFVGVFHMGVDGSLIATGGGYAVVVVCTLPIIFLRAGLCLRYDIVMGLLTFGLPNIINLLSGWVLQLSDRYLLGHLGSLPQAASYSVAYSLGSVSSAIIIMPFSLAWWAIMFSIARRDDALHIFRLVFRWFSIVLLFATLGVSFFAVNLLDRFFPPTYHAAALVIPIIALSNMFSGIFVVVALGTSLQRKTWLVAIFITSSALLNIGLNIVLIPLYGSMGAAVATLIAYIALAVITYCVNQHIYPVPFEIGLFIIALLIGIALYMGSDFLAQAQGIYLAWGIRIGTLILYAGCLLLLGKRSTGTSV